MFCAANEGISIVALRDSEALGVGAELETARYPLEYHIA